MIITNIIELKILQLIKKETLFIGQSLNLDSLEQSQFNELNNKYLNGYPLDYIIGEVLVNEVRLKTPQGVFIPRPCTEKLITLAQELIESGKFETVLDVCAGTGFIGIALAKKYKNINFISIENDDFAFQVLLENIKINNINNIKAINSDATSNENNYPNNSLLLCNPPYVPNIENDKSVRSEPEFAIYSGENGLTFFNKFIKLFTNKFPNQFIFELDPRNIFEAKKHFENNFYTEVIQDEDGFNRFLVGKRIIL